MNKEKDEEIEVITVSTGVTKNTHKMEATFSINTISEEDIKKLAPHGAADLLGNIPSFFQKVAQQVSPTTTC
ncbi:hypothetical protein [Psychrosphaera algicola]|uniref:Uncharacterized protein n=1 Tax=Psychrosphaera algicola TaxID=3023714 RepID=A0ABT5F7S6_9GAMM|nr:hypothetical protein [Psychrosphaera sp. G1-22]MDC2887590.1 hypothetical protein [Psychrosphaera sp. G1-22]